jgi:hyperosmotically inducible protein
MLPEERINRLTKNSSRRAISGRVDYSTAFFLAFTFGIANAFTGERCAIAKFATRKGEREMKKQMLAKILLSAALIASQAVAAPDRSPLTGDLRIRQEVRKELVTLPYYNLFDTLSYQVDGDTVTLTGKVTRPTLKSSAENVVKNIEGVNTVNNQIQVLPLSPNDDQLRRALYQSIYGHSVLQTLAIRAVPPIHIIVENGNVTLEGYVANSMQKNIAGIQANSVAGVFSVTNHLMEDDKS